MRISLKGDDYFCKQVNAAFEEIHQAYLGAVGPAVAMQKASAMLGDGTVTQTETFDPKNVEALYQRLAGRLDGWSATGVSRSATDDLHRIFCQFSKAVSKFHMAGYFGVQFHVLPYYRVNKRVIEIQKELAKIAEDAPAIFKDMTGRADRALQEELEKRGMAGMEFQELFTKMFEDDKLAQELDSRAASVEGQFPEFQAMGKRKNELFSELNDLLIELYQTSPAAIDYNRLMQGEEGVCTYFDIELVRGKKREAVFETKKIPKDAADKVASELLRVVSALKAG